MAPAATQAALRHGRLRAAKIVARQRERARAGAAARGSELAQARAWARALKDGNNDPKARELLVQHMNTSAAIAPTVPLSYYNMVSDLKPDEINDFQRLVDQATAYGLVKQKIDVKTMLKSY
jgi:hypothetical protein